jgi:hypothetical protein
MTTSRGSNAIGYRFESGTARLIPVRAPYGWGVRKGAAPGRSTHPRDHSSRGSTGIGYLAMRRASGSSAAVVAAIRFHLTSSRTDLNGSIEIGYLIQRMDAGSNPAPGSAPGSTSGLGQSGACPLRFHLTSVDQTCGSLAVGYRNHSCEAQDARLEGRGQSGVHFRQLLISAAPNTSIRVARDRLSLEKIPSGRNTHIRKGLLCERTHTPGLSSPHP